MEIKNKELKFKIYNALLKNENEDICEDELKSLKTISINQDNESSEYTKITEKEMEILKYAESLTLNFFDITDELVEQISSFEKLNCLVLNHCNFITEKRISNKLSNIIITYTKNFNLNIFTNTLQVKRIKLLSLENVDIKILNNYRNLEYIYIYNTNIENGEHLENFEKLVQVNLDGSNVSKELLSHLKNKNIKVHYDEEYLPIL